MNQDELDKSLSDACYDDDILNVKKYIQMGANVNNDRSSLITSIENWSYRSIKYLLENGADPNKEVRYMTPLDALMESLEDKYTQVFDCQELDINKEAEFKMIFELLINYGSEINKKSTKYNKTFLDQFIEMKINGNEDGFSFGEPIEKYLRSMGAKTSQELEQEYNK